MLGFIAMIILGLLFAILGIFNIQGNLSSIHWYHRRNVAKEDQRAYGKLMGAGTVTIGGSLAITGLLQLLATKKYWLYILMLGIVAGLILMIFAQLKYNKGIF